MGWCWLSTFFHMLICAKTICEWSHTFSDIFSFFLNINNFLHHFFPWGLVFLPLSPPPHLPFLWEHCYLSSSPLFRDCLNYVGFGSWVFSAVFYTSHGSKTELVSPDFGAEKVECHVFVKCLFVLHIVWFCNFLSCLWYLLIR